ncbi:hypothetical protein I308_100039 [Cryptococcus tetragattii IND107]|uniref:Uncharacterized protein n=1 Tax=Cryptococcus tetragattii IND107 TaxID=1296105 RepID=A0ABR3C3P1_9TREE
MRDHFPKNLNNEKCSSCSSQIEAMPNFCLLSSTPSNGKKDERQYTADVVREHLVPNKPGEAFLRAMSGDVHHGIPNGRLSALVEAVRLVGDAKRAYIQQAATAAHLAKAACELHRVCRHDRSDPRLENVHKVWKAQPSFGASDAYDELATVCGRIVRQHRNYTVDPRLHSKEQADFNEVQSLEDEPPHGSQSTDLNSAEDIHPSNSGSLAEGQAAVSMRVPRTLLPDQMPLFWIGSCPQPPEARFQRQATHSTSAKDAIRELDKEAMGRCEDIRRTVRKMGK